MAPRLRAVCTQKPAAAGSTGKEVAAEPTTTNRNKDGVATYTYGESLHLPEVTKEQAENAYLDATDVKRAMTPPISVAVEARDDMLKDRFNYVSSTPIAHKPGLGLGLGLGQGLGRELGRELGLGVGLG